MSSENEFKEGEKNGHKDGKMSLSATFCKGNQQLAFC